MISSNENRILAPILLFAYDRADHLAKVLDSIKKAELSEETSIYIFCDGAKKNASEEHLKRIEEVRALVQAFDHCKDKELIFSEQNKGLEKSIIGGINQVFEKHDLAIVLEDDIVISEKALVYFNIALNLYKDDDQVMHVTGFQLKMEDLPETFFLRYPPCWGWATWKSSWKNFIDDPIEIIKQLHQTNKFEELKTYPHKTIEILFENIDGLNKTWSPKWYASMFLKDGLSLHPKKSVVTNNGNDGSGENSEDSDIYLVEDYFDSVEIERIPIQEDLVVKEKLNAFYAHSAEAANISSNEMMNLSVKALLKSLVPNNRKHYQSLSKLRSEERFKPSKFSFQGADLTVVDKKYLLAEYENLILKGGLDFILDNSEGLILDALAYEGLSAYTYRELGVNNEIIILPQNRHYKEALKQNALLFKDLNLKIHSSSDSDEYILKTIGHNEIRLLRYEINVENIEILEKVLSSNKVYNFELMFRKTSRDIATLLNILDLLSSAKYQFRVKEYFDPNRVDGYQYLKRNFTALTIYATKI